MTNTRSSIRTPRISSFSCLGFSTAGRRKARKRKVLPIRKIELIDLRQSVLRDIKLSGSALLRAIECELRELYFIMADDVLNPPMPQLQNTDGEPLELQRLIFDIDSPQAAFDALAHLAFETTPEELLEDATRDANGALAAVQFDWAKTGNEKHPAWTNTILGHIEIGRFRHSMD